MILDSDVLVEVLRRNMRTSLWVAERGQAGEALRYSPVSRAEIGAGLREREEDAVARLFGGLEALLIDAQTGELAGERFKRYRKSHQLELGDALIGAAVEQHGEQLATFNRKRFPGITRVIVPPR